MPSVTSGRSWKIFLRRLTAARAWSLTSGSLRRDLGQANEYPVCRAAELADARKIRIAPVDDGVVADEQKTIDLYFRSGLIKQQLNAADIVDHSFSDAVGKGSEPSAGKADLRNSVLFPKRSTSRIWSGTGRRIDELPDIFIDIWRHQFNWRTLPCQKAASRSSSRIREIEYLRSFLD